MSVTSAQSANPGGPAKRPRGEGQWALGHREPLNPNERTKKDDDAAQRPGADREHLRPPGLRQHRPGRPARAVPLVRALHPAQAGHRRRPHGGPRAARARRRVLHAPGPHRRRPARPSTSSGSIADISTRYGRDTADITDRQNVQLHWIRIEDVPAIWRQLEAVGLLHHRGVRRHAPGRARQPGGRRRGGRGDRRHAGDRRDRSTVRRRPGVLQPAAQVQVGRLGWLPDVPYEANDISFVGVVHPEHGPGFDLWVGGGLSTNPMLAQRLGVWVPHRRDPGRLGRASSASSVTTATAGCAAAPA